MAPPCLPSRSLVDTAQAENSVPRSAPVRPAALLPAVLHRGLFRLAHWTRTRWWRVTKPQLEGCRVVAVDLEGKILAVRHSYGSPKWMLPGGGLQRNEDAVAAAVRELREETGCRLQNARLLARSLESLHGASNRVHIVGGWTRDLPSIDKREIVEARFFALDEIPDLDNSVRRQLPAWIYQVISRSTDCPS